VNSLPKTVTRQRRDYNLNPGLTVPESSTLTTWLPRQCCSNSRCAAVVFPVLAGMLKLFISYSINQFLKIFV